MNIVDLTEYRKKKQVAKDFAALEHSTSEQHTPKKTIDQPQTLSWTGITWKNLCLILKKGTNDRNRLKD